MDPDLRRIAPVAVGTLGAVAAVVLAHEARVVVEHRPHPADPPHWGHDPWRDAMGGAWNRVNRPRPPRKLFRG